MHCNNVKIWVLCYFKKDYCNCPLSKDPLNLKKKKFCFNNLNYTIYPELNFWSRILKFRLRLQKPRSFEASVGYIVIIFIIMFLIILTIFLNNIFSSFLAAILLQKEYKNWKKDNSQKKYMEKKNSWKNALIIVFFALFEYLNLGHQFLTGQMVRIYPDFG